MRRWPDQTTAAAQEDDPRTLSHVRHRDGRPAFPGTPKGSRGEGWAQGSPVKPSTAPWFHAPAAGWESARERLPRPLTREEATTDLRWWERQVRLRRDDPSTGRQLRRMPGRDRLASDWGWTLRDRVHTPNAVRMLLLDVLSWHPPGRNGEPHCAACAAALNHQGTTSNPPDATRKNADNREKTTREPPANHQETPGAAGVAPANHQESTSQTTDERPFSAEVHQGTTSGTPGGNGEAPFTADYGAPKKAREREGSTTSDPYARVDGHPADVVSHQAVTPAQRQLLGILKRWTDPRAEAPHRWVVDWGDVLAWWASKILTRPDYAQLDLAHQLERWDAYLERAAGLVRQRASRRGDPRFPKVWKNALHTWLSNAARYAARGSRTGPTPTSNGHDHGHDSGRRRATTRRRGQPQGDRPGFFDLQPTDAGRGDD